MRAFPSVAPSGRTFVGGAQRTSIYESISGKETRILLGDLASHHKLALVFENVLEAGVQSIMAHWVEAAGDFRSFTLPSTVYAGWSRYTTAVASNQQWRYESEPEVSAVSRGIMTVSVSLISVV
jgi:hypothetical protein